MASRLVHLAIIDALCASVALLQPERAKRTADTAANVITAHRM